MEPKDLWKISQADSKALDEINIKTVFVSIIKSLERK
jgi:hypothetical protein